MYARFRNEPNMNKKNEKFQNFENPPKYKKNDYSVFNLILGSAAQKTCS